MIRVQHQKRIDILHKEMQHKIALLEREKVQLMEQRTRTMELEKSKMTQLHKIDIEQAKATHERAEQQLREFHDKENDSLRK